MIRIALKYSRNGETKEFRCIGWNVYDSWMPYNGTQPIEMTVEDSGIVKTYTKFDLIRKEKFGEVFTKIMPKE